MESPRKESQSSSSSATLCAQATPERAGIHEVDERPLAVDLEHRDPLPIARFELGVAVDRHRLQRNAELLADLPRHAQRALAEMASGGVVDGDGGRRGLYGYSPRVTAASATRCTASP